MKKLEDRLAAAYKAADATLFGSRRWEAAIAVVHDLRAQLDLRNQRAAARKTNAEKSA